MSLPFALLPEENLGVKYLNEKAIPEVMRQAELQENDGVMRPPEIVNIVCSFNTRTTLDLSQIAENCSNVQYNPRRFTALIMRRTRPKATALMFNTGKVVVVGCTSLDNASKASRHFAKILRKYVSDVKLKDFKIYNMVANARLPYKLNLGAVKSHLSTDSLDQSGEQFPGLHISYQWSGGEHPLAVTLFSTGSIVFMGAKSKEEIDSTFSELNENLRECQYKEDPV